MRWLILVIVIIWVLSIAALEIWKKAAVPDNAKLVFKLEVLLTLLGAVGLICPKVYTTIKEPSKKQVEAKKSKMQNYSQTHC